MSKLIGDYMLDQNRQLHRKGKWGGSGYKSADDVVRWAQHLGARTMLDYGAGKGTLRKAIFESLRGTCEVDEYDPAVKGKERVPRKRYDMVACTDVMEHVEEKRVERVLRHIDQLSALGAFFVIACRPANKTLPDGRNAHITLRPSKWWIKQVRTHTRLRVVRAHVKMRKENLEEEKEVRLWLSR